MFIKGETGNLEITYFRIEDGGFAQNIDTLDGRNIFEQLTENVIGGKTQGIIDIKN